ncbi:MAG: thiol:disulfide interchange protein [Gammaproteobacteria bacterium]|jgi:thiol:disulfide interchange protein|tara:strand:+ start:679 stop:2646 length:1968 start_codon:yes stop_codon:yes gene_type:complete
MKLLNLTLFLLFSSFTFAEPVNTGHAKVSLVTDHMYSSSDSEMIVGIKMDMQSHWHTYWKNPGDSGGPIKVDWQLPEGVTVSNVNWPAPELIPYPPLMTYGYTDFVIFPFKLKIPNDLNQFNVVADINFLICDDICVPEKAILNASLNFLDIDSKLDKWVSKVPSVTLPVISEINNDYLELRFSKNNKIQSINFFIENENIVSYSSKQVLIKEENNWLLKVPLDDGVEINEPINGVLVINEDEIFIINTEVAKSENSISVIQAILFAFLGGLILNLMPCVFPIISLKVLSFISMGGESSNEIRKHALTFCLGVILSFVLVAVALLTLRQTGTFVGWGFQLQSPIVVGTLSILMFFIGLILLTDINIGSSLTRLGNVSVNKTGYTSSFLTGVLAVIVASPCTAPFMGAAIGYALIQPSAITLPIFLSLGIGFSMPYLLLAIKPDLISKMPRPGKWMESLKEFFAFPMFATAIWLVWVYSIQTSSDALIGLLIIFLVIGLLTWLYTKSTNSASKLILLVIGIIAMGYQTNSFTKIETKMGSLDTKSDAIQWNKDTEKDYQSNQQAYLINFTAAWCITCQANDKVALSRPGVKKFLNDNNIDYIVADWTNRNEEILDVLSKYGRSGVPLYVFWKPGMSQSKVLPAILTEQIVIDRISY